MPAPLVLRDAADSDRADWWGRAATAPVPAIAERSDPVRGSERSADPAGKERYGARCPKGKRALWNQGVRPIRWPAMSRMLLDPKTGRKLVSAADAARIFGCTGTHIRRLGQAGELRRVVESPRLIFYDLEDVKRLAREKAEIRKQRGGRPKRQDEAA